MKKIFLSAFILGSLTFTSCDKNDDDTSQNDTKVLPSKTIAKTVYEDGSYDEFISSFEYDAQNRLVKLVEDDKEVDDSGGYSSKTEYIFEYNGDQLTKIIENYSSTYNSETTITEYTFSITGNKVTVASKEDDYTESYVLNINEKGYLLSDEDYTYSYDAKGNIIQELSDFSKATYEYDDKNGISKNLNLPQWVLAGVVYSMAESFVNNPVKMKYEVFEYPNWNTEMQVTYQYNSGGYPTSGTAQTSDGSNHTITIQYK